MIRKLRSPSLLVAIFAILALALAAVAFAASRGAQPGPDTFKANNNGTVTDTTTALIWQQAVAPYSVTQADGVAYCASLTFAGHDDWRLPSMYELQRLVDYGRHSPAISPLFDSSGGEFLWSATPFFPTTSLGWMLRVSDGLTIGQDNTFAEEVRCVRG